MISSVEFVPAGALLRDPLRYEMSAEEKAEVEAAGAAEAELAEAAAGLAMGDSDDEEGDFEDEDEDEDEEYEEDAGAGLPAALRMETYDDEDGTSAAGLGAGFDGQLAELVGEGDDDEGSDAGDNVVEPTDSIILSCRTDDDNSILEVYCFDPATQNLWVHHDIPLAAFPLCTAFFDTPPSDRADGGASGAYVAVGTFKPGIELWNLDVLDPLEPTATLGGEDRAAAAEAAVKKGKKKGKKGVALGGGGGGGGQPPLKADSHTDAVMGLSWNRLQRQMLASGSADCCVKLWDVTTQQCSATLTHHTSKVQAVAWHPTEAAVLATGSYDNSMCALDVRSPTAVSRMAFGCDIEAIAWDPHCPERLVGAGEDGSLKCFDPRVPGKPLWCVQAHPKGSACSSVAFAPHVSGLFATASTDKTVKLWDAAGAAGAAGGGAKGGGGGGGGGIPQPICVGQRDMSVGKLFGMGWCGDAGNPWTLGAAGSKATLSLWMVDVVASVEARFQGRVSMSAGASLATGGNAAAAEALGLHAGQGALADAAAASAAAAAAAAAGAMPPVVLQSGGGGGGAKKKSTKKKGAKKASGAK